MSEYNICTDFFEIITGSPNRYTKEYTEAAKSIAEGTPQSLAYMKNFITSIESLANKQNVKDERISSTKGHLKNFVGYKNIETAMKFLKDNLGNVGIVRDLDTIYSALEKYESEYSDAYAQNVRLGILEYESLVYLLVTGLSMAIATNLDVVQNGYTIKIKKKSGKTYDVTTKTIESMAKQVSPTNHKEYLQGLMVCKKEAKVSSPSTAKTESAVLLEGTVSETISALDVAWEGIKKVGNFAKKAFLAVKNSLFGIVPLIRSIMYLRYKKKADTVLALDQQVKFIELNINQLQNMETADEAKKELIIKRQKAIIEQYKKKAEKLRAELCEGEKEAAIAIKKEDPKMKDTSGDGDFVLECATRKDFLTDDDIDQFLNESSTENGGE